MILAKTENLENDRAKLEIVVEKPQFDAACNEVYLHNKSRFNVPGFRRGKAPRKMIERVYGPGVFYEDAVDKCLGPAYADAVEQSGLEIVSRPDLDITQLDENGFTFTAQVDIYPEVTVKQYKGIHAHKHIRTATDEDVDQNLETLRLRNARAQVTEEPLADGDQTTIDFEGFLDGEPFEGGKSENHKATIGAGRLIPGFEEQLIGHKTGDEFDINVTFPDDYNAEHLAGKPAVFKIVIKECKKIMKPELDDDFAMDVSEFDTLDELKADIKVKIQEQMDQETDEDYENQIVSQLIEGVEGTVHQSMVDDRIDAIMQDFGYRISMQGMSLGDYMRFTGINSEQLQQQHEDAARRQVMSDLAFQYVAKAEDIQLTEEDIEAEYKRLAEKYEKTVEEVKTSVPEKSLRHDLLSLRASEFIKAAAIEDPDHDHHGHAHAAKKEASEEKTEEKTEEKPKPKPKPRAKKPAVKKEEETEQ